MALNTRGPTVVGVFSDRDQLRRAVEELRRAGFREEQIAVATHLEEETAGGTDILQRKSYKEEGAAVGAISLGVLGGVAGALAVVLIPGFGPILVGTLLEAVLGGALAGIIVGGVLGWLIGLSVPEEEARYYLQEFRAGHSIVTVRAGDRRRLARDILFSFGAHDFESRGQKGGPEPSEKDLAA